MARGAYSSVLSQARGRVGEQVYVKTRSGLAIKARPRYRQFPNPATAGARERMIRAKDAWLGLDVDQVKAWRAFARSIRRVNPVDGTEYSPIAYNAFIMLATRYLQANPTGEIPLMPPTDEFAGEDVVLEVNKVDGLRRTADSCSKNERRKTKNEMERAMSLGASASPSANGQRRTANDPANGKRLSANDSLIQSPKSKFQNAVVRFSASAPNSPDVVTEILVQKLPNIRRSPTKFYKSTAIHRYLPGELTFDLDLPAGVYVFAYRFIQATTGLCTGLWTWEEVVVVE